MNETERLKLIKSLASDRVASYARAVARAMREGELIGPTLAEMFCDAVEAHEAAREALMRGLSEVVRAKPEPPDFDNRTPQQCARDLGWKP
jgi:hypothetical protein